MDINGVILKRRNCRSLQLIMTSERFQYLLLSLIICISTGHAKPPSRIVNGTLASNIPYQVSIRGPFHLCGGSIIDKRHILTAAHCYPAITVLLGTNDKDNQDEENIYRVADRIYHPDYNRRKFMNDIAILILDRDIIFNEYQRPISLPEKETAVDTLVSFSGWGDTQGTGSFPRYLQTKTGRVMDQFECFYDMDPSHLNENHTCVSTEGQGGICFYDSGGPLVDGSVLVGIASFVKYNCDVNYPGVFVRVHPYVPWIRQVIDDFNQNYSDLIDVR